MEEQCRRHAGLFEGTIGTGAQIATADTIDQDSNRNAARLSGGQSGDEMLARLVVIENVGRQADRMLGRFDGAEHFGEGLVAIFEDAPAIARQQRMADQHAAGPGPTPRNWVQDRPRSNACPADGRALPECAGVRRGGPRG